MARWVGTAVMSEKKQTNEHYVLRSVFFFILHTWLEMTLATRWTNKYKPLMHVMFSGHCSPLELLRLTDFSCQGYIKNTLEEKLHILEVLGQRDLLPGILLKDWSPCSCVIPLLGK